MAKVKLYNVAEGRETDYTAEVDQNGEVVLTSKTEVLKFPAGLTKTQFQKAVNDHNKANKGVKARTAAEVRAETEAKERSEKLVDSL